MAPTMQVACKAFIAPNSATRSPKERYTHVPHSPRRHARCFLVECPTRGDGQDWDGSHLLELLLNATSLSPLATAKALGLDIPPTIYSHSRMKSSSNPLLRLWVNRLTLTARRSLPVCPTEPTSSEPGGMSQTCQIRNGARDLSGGRHAVAIFLLWCGFLIAIDRDSMRQQNRA
jgi:hypothetical protein